MDAGLGELPKRSAPANSPALPTPPSAILTAPSLPTLLVRAANARPLTCDRTELVEAVYLEARRRRRTN